MPVGSAIEDRRLAWLRKELLGLVTGSLLLGMALPAGAGDGRSEINQAAALFGGITTSDLPGFPVTLDRSGSYVLTGSLSVPDAATDAIEIVASEVTLDLAGFSVSGPVSCTGDGGGLICTPSGAGVGVDADGQMLYNSEYSVL